MTKQNILNHFKNGDVVECLIDGEISVFNSETLGIKNGDWYFLNPKTNTSIVIESNGKLARIIQHDKTEVYAQLGKEVEVILNEWCNDCEAGVRIRKLYGK